MRIAGIVELAIVPRYPVQYGAAMALAPIVRMQDATSKGRKIDLLNMERIPFAISERNCAAVVMTCSNGTSVCIVL